MIVPHQGGLVVGTAGTEPILQPLRNSPDGIARFGAFDEEALLVSTLRPSYAFWSSSPNAYYPDRAWGVSFYYGYVSSGPKSDQYYIRLVRGGE